MKQYIIILFSLLTTISYSQDKSIHLAHGLGGEGVGWDSFIEFLSTSCPDVSTTNFQMSSTEGIEVYSSELENQLQDAMATTNDIAIGHSFGGLNLRNMDYLNTPSFGGYITVGSAHQGAQLANSASDGLVETWAELGCTEIVDDIVIPINNNLPGFLDDIPVLDNILETAENIAEFNCGGLYEGLLVEASEFLGEGETVSQIEVDGIISMLPPANLPAIGVVCSTDSHVLAKLLQDSDFIDGVDFNNLAGMDLEEILEVSNIVFTTSANILENISNSFILNTFAPNLANALYDYSQEVFEGAAWIATSESVWNQLIGAGGDLTWVDTPSQNWICHCVDYSGTPIPCDLLDLDEIELTEISQICNPNPDCWETTYTSTPVFGPDKTSDGLVPTSSQSLPGSIHEEFVDDASHFAQPSDPGVHAVLLEQLRLDLSPNSFFIINNCL